jgi:type II secretory pathway pseudopilin PulG
MSSSSFLGDLASAPTGSSDNTVTIVVAVVVSVVGALLLFGLVLGVLHARKRRRERIAADERAHEQQTEMASARDDNDNMTHYAKVTLPLSFANEYDAVDSPLK